MTIEFPYNKSAMAQAIADAYPAVPADRRAGWLNGSMIATMQSDGETWYYADNVGNMRYHNLDLMQNMTAAMNQTPLYDPLTHYAFAAVNATSGPYGGPVAWEGTEVLSVPRDQLPANGTLRLWFPQPIGPAPRPM